MPADKTTVISEYAELRDAARAMLAALRDAKMWINVEDQDADKMIARCDAAIAAAEAAGIKTEG